MTDALASVEAETRMDERENCLFIVEDEATRWDADTAQCLDVAAESIRARADEKREKKGG